jgi:hypothetical protein
VAGNGSNKHSSLLGNDKKFYCTITSTIKLFTSPFYDCS